MDFRDSQFDLQAALEVKFNSGFGYAVLLTLADAATSRPARLGLLALYAAYGALNARADVRTSIIQALSLAGLPWFPGFRYGAGGDVSLLSVYAARQATHMALMTFGNAALWVAIPGVRFDGYSIVLGNAELVAYCVTWSIIRLVSWAARFCLRPFEGASALVKAVFATVVVECLVVLLTRGAIRRRRRAETVSRDVDMTAQYTYDRSLTTGMEIRLLKVFPRDSGEEVYCEIVYHLLPKMVDYHAISYTWGDTTEKTTMAVNGKAMVVPRKVAEMLRALRHDWKPVLLWIDFVCINQNDNDEKSHEIQLMRHVYHRAMSVIVWLDPLPDSIVAIEVLVEMARNIQFGGMTASQGQQIYGQVEQRARVLSLARFLANDYFNRLWTVQEVASSRALEVICGNHSILWEDLSQVLVFFGNPEMVGFLQRTDQMDVVSCNQDSLRHGQMTCQVKAHMTRDLSFNLARTLMSFRSFKCKDPRDKVYALLGLVGGVSHPLVEPDYNKSEVQLYKDVARYVFTIEDTAKPLFTLPMAGVGHWRRLEALPSWAPDWASNQRAKRLPEHDGVPGADLPAPPPQSAFSYYVGSFGNYGNGYETFNASLARVEPPGPGPTPRLGYRASLDTAPQLELRDDDDDDGVLRLRGFLVDEIVEMTPVFDLPFDDDMCISHVEMSIAYLAWFDAAEALAARAPVPYPGSAAASATEPADAPADAPAQAQAQAHVQGDSSSSSDSDSSNPVEDLVWRTLLGDRLLEARDLDIVRPAPPIYGAVYAQLKAANRGLRRAAGVVGLRTAVEMRDLSHGLYHHVRGGGSVFEHWLRAMCGRSGHPCIWRYLTAGTAWAAVAVDGDGDGDGGEEREDVVMRRPAFPEDEEAAAARGDHAFWARRFEEFCAADETRDIAAAFVGLTSLFSEPGSAAGMMATEMAGLDTAQDIDAAAADKIAEAAALIPRFSEGIRTAFERRMCLTRKGYVGLVPPLTREGDRVCVLYGGDTPYLVRPEGADGEVEGGGWTGAERRCQLVGECYMHGMMDGQMMSMPREDLWFLLY
ncbi:heterokaryon incompatibility protein-domain-containing protein [Xylariaceae sp. FL0016]|nr:heterokaryon incompatibility protein-domain-containing protein [Xylariaceae sp. FL0016]